MGKSGNAFLNTLTFLRRPNRGDFLVRLRLQRTFLRIKDTMMCSLYNTYLLLFTGPILLNV